VHNLIAQAHLKPEQVDKYPPELAMLIARLIINIRHKVNKQGARFAQQYILQKRLKVFSNKGHTGASKELDQLHQRTCFGPIAISKLTPSERKKAMKAFMFLTEKHDGTIKGRLIYNGKPTREWMQKDKTASPTASLETVILTGVIDAKEGQSTMTCNVPNAFVQVACQRQRQVKIKSS
jgi:hypothetical protein